MINKSVRTFNCHSWRTFASKVRKGFGSFHSENIEVLVRQSKVDLPDELVAIQQRFIPILEQQIKNADPTIKLRKSLFCLDEGYTFLNHGAFGGALQCLMQEAQAWRLHCEQQPLKFYDRQLFPLMAHSLQSVASLLHCKAEDLLPLPNVTSGINAICNSVSLQPQDEVILLSLTYGSTKKIVKDYCLRAKATMKIVHYPLPLLSHTTTNLPPKSASIADTTPPPPPPPTTPSKSLAQELFLDQLLSSITSKTKLIILDEITSNTAIQLPVHTIAAICKAKQPNIFIAVDAAHALFMLPSNLHSSLESIDFWLTNAHKWFSVPKGVGLLYINPTSKIHTTYGMRPPIISHGYQPAYHHDDDHHPMAKSLSKGQYLSGFVWDGCRDYAAWLTLPSAIQAWNLIDQYAFPSSSNPSSSTTHPHTHLQDGDNLQGKDQWNQCRKYNLQLLDEVEQMFQDQWNLQADDYACPYDLRKNLFMRLVSEESFVFFFHLLL
jgi:selenocysteine lyase/cysteine desulfurase